MRARADHAVAEHEGAERELALLAPHGELLCVAAGVDEAEPREEPRSGLVAAEGGLVRTLADLGNPRRLASPELAYERIGGGSRVVQS